MTTVVPHARPAAQVRRVRIVAPAAAPSTPFPAEPVDRRARYWDVAAAGWRSSPGDDSC